MGKMLEELALKRDDLLVGEMAALLHQMGKCTNGFIFNHLGVSILNSSNSSNSTMHAVSLRELQPPFITEAIAPQWNVTKNSDLWEKIFTPRQQEQLRSIPFTMQILDESYTLLQLLAVWHRDSYETFTHTMFQRWLAAGNGSLIWLLDQSHGVAHIDKANLQSSSSDERPDSIGKTNAFGSMWTQFQNNRGLPALDLNTLIQGFDFNSLATAADTRNSIIAQGTQTFGQTVSETQQPATEVSLWDWHWATAALYKAYLAKIAIEMPVSQTGAFPNGQKRNELYWRTLSVTIDELGLLTRAHRLADILGYQQAVAKALDDIRHLVEVQYPLGNQIYRDTTGAYFTFPDLQEKQQNDILQELRKAIPCLYEELTPIIGIGERWQEGETNDSQWVDAPKMIADVQRKNDDAIISGEWSAQHPLPPWGNEPGEICPVCGIRPITVDYRGQRRYRQRSCTVCQQRSNGSLHNWKKNGETIWLDEIADANDRVTLIAGNFHLHRWLSGKMIRTLPINNPLQNNFQEKLPSPARILRVWRTTQDFWEQTVVGEIINKHYKDHPHQRYVTSITWKQEPKPNETVLDGTAGNYPISLYRDGQQWLVTINPEIAHIITDSHDIPVQVRQDDGDWRVGTIMNVAADAMSYQPTRTILTSPDHFLAFVPTTDALMIANNILTAYEMQMGKVRSRLPLDLALITFPRKLPLYAVMDAARRFLRQPEPSEATWTVKQRQTHEPETVNQCESILFQTANEDTVTWSVSTVFGDGTEDSFYPYIAVKSAEADYHCHVDTGETKTGDTGKANADNAQTSAYLHVSKLKQGDEVNVRPSRFSYLWMENTVRRYTIGMNEQHTFATQNLPIEEIAWQKQTWEQLQRRAEQQALTMTELHGIIEVLLARYQDWNISEDISARTTFATFAGAVLKRHGLDEIITPHDVTNGRLFRCFDLYCRIAKQTLKG